MSENVNQLILDVGGGKQCPFAKYRNPAANSRILALDVSPEEIKSNTDVDAKIVADVIEGLPFRYSSVDLIASRSVLEHVRDVGRFVANATEVLKENGYFIQLFPSKFAPFALINQMLPKRTSRRLVHFFLPEKKGICGFPAIYNKCYYAAMAKLLRRNGLELVSLRCTYYQSRYFDFFFPLFVVSAVYEMLLRALRLRNLCAYLLVVARKKTSNPEVG